MKMVLSKKLKNCHKKMIYNFQLKQKIILIFLMKIKIENCKLKNQIPKKRNYQEYHQSL